MMITLAAAIPAKGRRSVLYAPGARTKLWCTVLLAILCCGCNSAKAQAEAIGQADYATVDSLIQKWIDAGNYPGAGIWIVDSNGRTLHERYWKGYTRQTTVMIASSSKWLEAAAMMALVDEGKLKLDEPISTYLPGLTGPQGENTLRQMFSHTSSLNHIAIDDTQGIDRFPALLAAGHTDVKPGSIFSYGGTALATASRAIEVVTGVPWLTVFGQKIARPCGMRSTVTGHNLWTYSGIVGGDLYPQSNAADYMNFLRMILNDGVLNGHRVLSSGSVREMEADQVGRAVVKRPEYPESTLGQTHHGVYGLGEWRLVLDSNGPDANGPAVVLSSPSFAGFLPWIDKRHGIAAVFVGRSSGGIDAFHASAELVRLVDASLEEEGKRQAAKSR